jgi:hypothetical protein
LHQALRLYFALIENQRFLTSKNSGSQFNRSLDLSHRTGPHCTIEQTVR